MVGIAKSSYIRRRKSARARAAGRRWHTLLATALAREARRSTAPAIRPALRKAINKKQ